MGIPEIKYNQLGIAGHTEMDELFYNDRPMILVVYYKYWIIALGYDGMWYHGRVFIPASLYTVSQFGMTGDISIDELFYNDRPMILVVYYKYWVIAFYTISTVTWDMMEYHTKDLNSIPGSL